MNKKQTLIDYEARINRVVQYIHDHLDDDLNMDQLAEIACFSPYHWHRIYRAMMGETAAQTVRRLRLLRASEALIRSADSIEHISRKAGYASVEAFHRAFAKDYQSPPATYRRRSQERHLQFTKEQLMIDVEIRKTKPRKLITIAHNGPYMEIGRAFERLYVWASSRSLINEMTQSIGIYLDDPSSIAAANLRSLAGLVVLENFEPDDDKVELYDLSGGRCAVYVHKGPYSELEKSYDLLFCNWLPQSGEQPGKNPVYEVYLNNPQTTPASELLTDIHLPLAD